MKKVPNENEEIRKVRSYVKNDLYKKFRVPFEKILNKDFDEGGVYRKKAYVSVAPDVEDTIKEILSSTVDSVTPLTGYTGIGKTHLMMSAINDYYNRDDILPNNAIIAENNGKFDILLYCAHERYNRAILDDIESLLYSRIETLCKVITDKWGDVEVKNDEIMKYIDETKREINFYYVERAKEYATAATKFKILLRKIQDRIHNIVIVYDDLESLDGEQQFTLIRDLLSIFECFRNSRPKNINFKFFFCMRTTTYCNLAHHPGFDTHRTASVLILDKYPSMKQLFEKRFGIIVEDYKIYEQTQNQLEWKEAKDFLMQLADRIEGCSKDLLYELSNYNVSTALEKFTKILSNRFWTQKNKNPSASFKIKDHEYYINNANIFKVLFMGEGNVFWSDDVEYEASIFYRGGHLFDDFLCLYILRYYYKKYIRGIKVYEKESCTLTQLQEDLVGLFGSDKDDYKNRMFIEIRKIFDYFLNCDFIREDDLPRKNITSDIKRYHLTPKGYAMYKNFMSSSILFEIFRDEFAFDETRYNIQCSRDLTQEQLFVNYMIYIEDFWKYECQYIHNILENELKKDDYIDYFGETTLSLKMVNGLFNSVEKFYGDRREKKEQEFIKKIGCLKNKVEKEGCLY